MIPLSYNIRSLRVRKTTTLATAMGVALVVFVLASAMMLVAGIKKTLAVGGRADNAIVLSVGGDDEVNSSLDEGSTRTISALPMVHMEGGKPLFVAESVAVGIMQLKGGRGFTNVILRGITDSSLVFRPELKVVEGRRPQPGTDEVMIGQRLRGRFENLEMGGRFELKKNRPAVIVGVFSAGGSSHESEIWVDRDVLRAVYGREGLVSSMRVRLNSPGAFDGFAAAIQADKRLGLKALKEPEWLERQTESLTFIVGGLGGAVAFFMAIGAMIGAMITMYGSVANRQREIGTLRALGFPRLMILLSFLLEAMVLSAMGGAIGVVCAMGMKLAKFSMMSSSWAEIVFSFDPTPEVLVSAFLAALAMGLLGGFFPALRAARISAVAAMRG